MTYRLLEHKMNKKGYAMLLDSIAALTFILLIGMLIVHLYQPKMSQTSIVAYKNLHYVSEDILDVLNKQGVLDDIGTEWATSNGSTNSTHFENATNITKEYMEQLIPSNIGYRVTIDDVVIYDSDLDNTSNRIRESDSLTQTYASRLLVGYAAGLPTVGHIARSFLTNIRAKETSAYIYFGGFVGQGNLTRTLELPASMETVIRAYVEVAAGSEFELYVNDVSTDTFTPSGGNMSANIKEYVSTPDNYFIPGDNDIELRFTSDDITEHYLGGGFISVTYNTTEMETTTDNGTGTHWFPGIDGLINLYSSFYVPGDLTSMRIHLKFFNNYTTYLNINDQEVFNSDGDITNQTIDLYDVNLTMLEYDGLSESTNLLRLGTEGISYLANVTGNADVVLITDLSGSMSRCLDGSSGGCTGVEGENPQRLELVKDLDKEFVNRILNSSGNRIGLVSYSGNARRDHDLSDDAVSLETQINLYTASGPTGTCTAIREARILLEEQSNNTRQGFIVVMTDGIPNQQCNPVDLDDTTSCCQSSSVCARSGGPPGHEWYCCCCCWSYCEECAEDYGWFKDATATCGDFISDNAITHSIEESSRVHNETNATVYSVGFITPDILTDCPEANQTLSGIAEAGNGTSFASTNRSMLDEIYADIAEEIVNVSYRSQTAMITGTLGSSILYPESYISFNYTASVGNVSIYGEITLTQDTERFNNLTNCTGTLFTADVATLVDAKVTSYSAEHWTDYVDVVNDGGSYIVYSLRDSSLGNDYHILGDPYTVQIPPDFLVSGTDNTVSVRAGDSPDIDAGCSVDNRAIYTIRLQSGVGYGDVFTEREGCIWNIQFEDDSELAVNVPGNYTGTEECSYRVGNVTDNSLDAIDDAIYRLLVSLDSNENEKLDIKFDSTMLEFSFTRSGGVRSLWGPANFKLIMWM